MKRLLAITALLPWSLLLFLIIGCEKPEQIARDSIAAAQGAIVSAQAKHHDACVAQPQALPCQTINRAIDSERLALDALRAYCQFTPADDPAKVCQPVRGALPALQTAVQHLNQLTLDVKGLLQ